MTFTKRTKARAVFRLLVLLAPVLPLVTGARAAPAPGPAWWFVDATVEAGLASSHAYLRQPTTEPQRVAGGAAVGDFDGDGAVDIYAIGGDAGRDMLFRNLGDGTFIDVASAAGVTRAGISGSGPLFFDYDGDGRLDLFVGAVDGAMPALFHNQAGGTFAEVTARSGLTFGYDTVSATAADYDGDGWLDLFLSHWGGSAGDCHLWHNEAGQTFRCADAGAGLDGLVRGLTDRTFTANFVDLDADGRLDLVVTADYGQSTVWHNEGQGRFANVTTAVISDQNGMGSAVGDYDGDGDLDWFVSSIRDDDGTTEGNWGTSGNRLYRNAAGGRFEDATDEAGVRDGDWGWGATFADLDNDGWSDLIHVNGWPQGSPQFRGTAARVFLSDGRGHYRDEAESLRLVDRVGGRGVVCLDYDRDGDLDVFVANNNGPYHLWRNAGGRARGHYLAVSVVGQAPNAFAVGAQVFVTAGGRTQRADVRAGSNYVSQNPLQVHFGLGQTAHVDRVRVVWPDGKELTIHDVEGDRELRVSPGAPPDLAAGGCGCAGA